MPTLSVVSTNDIDQGTDGDTADLRHLGHSAVSMRNEACDGLSFNQCRIKRNEKEDLNQVGTNVRRVSDQLFSSTLRAFSVSTTHGAFRRTFSRTLGVD